jgi:hypothetical protein
VLEGDQICTINGVEMVFASSANAREQLANLRGMPLHMTLRANPPIWALYKQRMAALQLDQIEVRKAAAGGQAICIQALFDYNPAFDHLLSVKDRRRMDQLFAYERRGREENSQGRAFHSLPTVFTCTMCLSLWSRWTTAIGGTWSR